MSVDQCTISGGSVVIYRFLRRTKLKDPALCLGWFLFLFLSIAPAQETVTDNEPPNEQSQDLQESNDEVVIDCEAVIERRQTGQAVESVLALVDLPALEGGKKYLLKIKVINPYEDGIQFSKVTLSCGCVKLITKSRKIAGLGTATYEMHLDVPNQVPTGRVSQTATFYGTDSPQQVLALRIDYDVIGVYGFLHDRIEVGIPSGKESVISGLPIRLVPPITVDQLELIVSDSLRDINLRLESDPEDVRIARVRIEANRQFVPKHGILGDLTLRHRGAKHESNAIVYLTHLNAFTLRPESIRFTTENQSNRYMATAMLRVQVARTDEEGDSEERMNVDYSEKGGGSKCDAEPKIELTIDGQPAEVLLRQLGGSGIYRLTIHYDGQPTYESGATVPVRWSIFVDGTERVIESLAFF